MQRKSVARRRCPWESIDGFELLQKDKKYIYRGPIGSVFPITVWPKNTSLWKINSTLQIRSNLAMDIRFQSIICVHLIPEFTKVAIFGFRVEEKDAS